jgi:hypothetical protein
MFAAINYKGDYYTPEYNEPEQHTMPYGEAVEFTSGGFTLKCEEDAGILYYTVTCNKGRKCEISHIDLWELPEQSPEGLREWAEEYLTMWIESNN